MDALISLFDLPLTLGAVPPAVEADPPAIMRFFGRLHPLMVHFPIALILAAALFEVLRSVRRGDGERPRGGAALPCLVLGAIGACVAAYFGWLNADFEPQTRSLERTLFLHRWAGVATAGAAVIAVIAASGRRFRIMENTYRAMLALAVILVGAGGYLGGELTYPENYLWAVFQSADDDGAADVVADAGSGADSGADSGGGLEGAPANVPVEKPLSPAALAYVNDVAPILEARCYECHGPVKQKGRMRLDRKSDVFHDEEQWWIIIPGDSAQSLLYERITLPADDPDIMPAKGDPLTTEQIATIKAWIDAGAEWPTRAASAAPGAPVDPASAEAPVKTAPAPDDPAAKPAPAKATPAVPAATQAKIERAVEALRTRGAVALPIAADTDALDVNLSLVDPPATDDDLVMLADLAPRLAWLNLARSAVTDAGLAHLSRFTALERLRLENTKIGDAGLAHLAGLKKLVYLNLYGTGVTDAGLAHLENLDGLRQLYLWQTAVTEDGVAALRAARPDLTVVLGAELAIATESEDETEVEQKLPNCCAKAEEAGGECDHPCCVEARANGTICAKCASG